MRREEPKEKHRRCTQCFTIEKSSIRRGIRVALLTVLFILIFALPWILVLISETQSEFHPDAIKLDRITMQNCRLFFQNDDTVPVTQPTVSVKTSSKY